jgi:hypothetical protein
VDVNTPLRTQDASDTTARITSVNAGTAELGFGCGPLSELSRPPPA